jgi:predicted cation transporter
MIKGYGNRARRCPAAEGNPMIVIGLCIILLLVLVLPFLFKKIEHNLELFLFVMGAAAAFLSSQMNWRLIFEALYNPIPITLAVLAFGLIFKWLRKALDRFVNGALRRVSIHVFVFFLVFVLGCLSSMITAIIASLILVEIISILRLNRGHEIRIIIIACFSIGLGAVLTPIGEPLSTIAIAKLKSWPGVNFWYLAHLLGWEVVGGILILSVISLFLHGRHSRSSLESRQREESYPQIFLRAGKVYLFVMALIFLGQGFKPVIDTYIIRLSGDALYWINSLSAILDNATLTAAEISPMMDPIQIKKILMGLLIAGGMLIPGNIPNIIAASRLGIKSKEWARFGLPLGLVLMVFFFIILKVL